MSFLARCLRRSQDGDRRLLVGALGVLIVMMLALGTALTAAAGQLDSDAPSPASGHAQVIAHGVSEMPAANVAWRVLRASAPRPQDSPVQEALGFVLADEDALMLHDIDADARARLAAGEAAFVAEGLRQTQFALGDGPVDYYRIDLVNAADVNDAGGDELVYAGETFGAPEEDRDLDLLRDVLDQDEEAELTLGSTQTPALVFVTAGEAEIVPANDPNAGSNPLAAGQAATVAGDVVIRGVGAEGTTYVAAVIGPEVPPVPTQDPAPTETPVADDASIAVEAYACPVPYEGQDFGNDCREPVADLDFHVVIPATEFSLTETTDAGGRAVFAGLDANTYALTGGVPAESAVQPVFCVAEGGGQFPAEPTGSEIPGAVLELGAGDDITCFWYVVAGGPQGEPGGPDLGNDGVDMDCADFPELNAARGYFVGDGGSAARNVDNLDADRDGAACEPGDDGDNTEPAAAATL